MILRLAISCSIFLIAYGCGPMQGFYEKDQIQLIHDAPPHEPTFACRIYPWICQQNHSHIPPGKTPFDDIAEMLKIRHRIKSKTTKAPLAPPPPPPLPPPTTTTKAT
ncbi:unnamed protein product, partial [Brugia timori]